MTESSTYYSRRFEEELAAAECAHDPAATQVHREMARLYGELISGIPGETTPTKSNGTEIAEQRALHG